MKKRLMVGVLSAGAMIASLASNAQAGWFSGERHHEHYQSRFLQRPCPPYHGWNRPFYGWSSNYRPYYFTPQSYANTPWNYGPGYQESIYQTAAPTPGLNAYGVPVTKTTTSTPAVATPTPAPPAVPVPATVPTPPPAIPEPPKPGF
jgi:hypothetical protein